MYEHIFNILKTNQWLDSYSVCVQSIIKDYVNNDDQFTRKSAIPQDKFFDLVNLVLTTTWYIFKSQF